MSLSEPLRTPLSIYVVFHPDSAECRELADHLHDWFRLKQDDGDGTEAGLPIWYRARLTGGQLSPAIDWNDARVNAVVVLLDDHAVADASWRKALVHLRGEARREDLILYAPVDDSAFRTGLLDDSNRLATGAPRPAEEPEAPTDEVGRTARAARITARARVLRRSTTESLIRHLRNPDAKSPPAPLSAFISHAKRDGVETAKSLRAGFPEFGQVKPWYDENELPAGHPWDHPMRTAVAGGTAALVSVVTDAYPTRYWCRQEVNLARTPRELDVGSTADTFSAWTVQPAVAVAQPQTGWSRPMAQLAQVPQIGWSAHGRVEDVVDRLLLEVLLVSFYRFYAPELSKVRLTGGRSLAVLTWVPDPWSLTHLSGRLQRRDPRRRWVLAYPGHGVRTAELAELRTLLSALDEDEADPRFELVTQERVGTLDDVPGPGVRLGLRVALSGGGNAADLEPAGVGLKHLDDLVVRLTRRLLELDCQVIYGGSLNAYATNLTQALIEAAKGWDAQATRDRDATAPPLVNYSAWPYYRFLTVKQVAETTNICSFELVEPGEGPPEVPAASADTRNDPAHARLGADALTRMRRLSTAASDARVVMGGKVRAWEGWLPGVAEEAACSLEAGQLPLVLGGFGGGAAELATFLKDPHASWPAALGFDAAKKDKPFQTLTAAPGAEEEARRRFSALEATLTTWRAQLHGAQAWPFPWADREQVRALLSTSGPAGAIELVLRVLARVPRPTGGAD